MGADRVPRAYAAIRTRPLGKDQMRQCAGCGQKALGHVFGIKAAFKRVPVDAQFLLGHGQALARGNAQLPFNQIDARDGFGHGVFDLQTRVHFHEPEPVGTQAVAAVDDEFHRAGPLIADGLGGAYCRLPHGLTHFDSHARRRGFFDNFLVAPLQRTITFKQMHGLFTIAKNLHLDMARLADKFFDQNVFVAKGRRRFAARTGQCVHEFFWGLYQTHSLAAAPGNGLDQYRITNCIGSARQMFRVLIAAMIPGHNRHAGFLHQRLGRIL